MRELYVYYTLPSASSLQLMTWVHTMQSDLCQRHPGLSARLLKRSDQASGTSTTWMEIYAQPGGIDTGVQDDIDAAARCCPLFQEGGAQRHVEVFHALHRADSLMPQSLDGQEAGSSASRIVAKKDAHDR